MYSYTVEHYYPRNEYVFRSSSAYTLSKEHEQDMWQAAARYQCLYLCIYSCVAIVLCVAS